MTTGEATGNKAFCELLSAEQSSRMEEVLKKRYYLLWTVQNRNHIMLLKLKETS